jgi:hypothetical protein
MVVVDTCRAVSAGNLNSHGVGFSHQVKCDVIAAIMKDAIGDQFGHDQ